MEQTPDQIAQSALGAFGKERQIDKCIEELGELTTALMRWKNGEAGADAVIDELADVAISGNTLCILFGKEAVDARVRVKLARLVRLVADQVALNAEKAKPVKPVLRWEVGMGDELVMYENTTRIGSVSRSPYWAHQWTATASSVKTVTTHASKEEAMHQVCMNLGLSVCEVSLWMP